MALLMGFRHLVSRLPAILANGLWLLPMQDYLLLNTPAFSGRTVVDNFLSAELAGPSGTHRRALFHHFTQALKVNRAGAKKKQDAFFNITLPQDFHIQAHFADDALGFIGNENLLFNHVFL